MYDTKSPTTAIIGSTSIGQSNNNVGDSTDKEFEDILNQLNALGNTIDQELSQKGTKTKQFSSNSIDDGHHHHIIMQQSSLIETTKQWS
nr:uncharacterized protein LOC124499117 [Dermatophagoides farinae]